MARKVAPSLLTGSTIVIKPSSETPCTTFAFAELASTIGLPDGVLNFVSGSGGTLGNALAKSPDVGMVTLTGSVEAGQKIIAATAENITKTSLELGGKAPVRIRDGRLCLRRPCFLNRICHCCVCSVYHGHGFLF